MRKKQYLISNKKLLNVPIEFIGIEFHGISIYRDSDLEMSKSENDLVSILLLGFIIDPFFPDRSSEEIIIKLSQLENKNAFFKELENYSGRYVILYKNKNDLLVLHDMFGQRQINYSSQKEIFILSSSVQLLNESLCRETEFIPEHEKLIKDNGFSAFDQWFLGDLTWDKNVKKLLPNHYLNLHELSVSRIPFFPVDYLDEDQVIALCKAVVEGNYKAICNRYEGIFQALTAGYDSRTLLALSKNNWNQIQFYTFRRKDANSQRDARIANKLSHQFLFNHQTITNIKKDLKFEYEYKQNFIIPRTTPKYYNILYFQKFQETKTINITGDGVQMVRNLRSPEQLRSAEQLFDSLKYEYKGFHLNNFSNWLEEARKTANEHDILISDLFTQEIAQGQLTSRWALEFDLSGCEEFNPFSHKRMIYTILKNIPYEKKISPDYHFQKKLMESAVSGITDIPFNPPTWKGIIKKIIGYK